MMKRDGLNTIELDVKDENGEIGFVPTNVPLASQVGAAKRYYNPIKAAATLGTMPVTIKNTITPRLNKA